MLDAYRANKEVSWLCFQLTSVLSVPASYKAVCKVPGGTAPVPAGEEARAVRLRQEVSAAPVPIPAVCPTRCPCFSASPLPSVQPVVILEISVCLELSPGFCL